MKYWKPSPVTNVKLLSQNDGIMASLANVVGIWSWWGLNSKYNVYHIEKKSFIAITCTTVRISSISDLLYILIRSSCKRQACKHLHNDTNVKRKNTPIFINDEPDLIWLNNQVWTRYEQGFIIVEDLGFERYIEWVSMVKSESKTCRHRHFMINVPK